MTQPAQKSFGDLFSPQFDTPGVLLGNEQTATNTSSRSTACSSIAVVHDWCPQFRGGERVIAEICRAFNAKEVFTLFDFLPDDIKREHFPSISFHTSIANKLPQVARYYQALFFLCPFLIEQFDVTKYDAVISSSAAFARGVLTRPDQPHLCYVHTPARYAWDEQFSYFEQANLGHGLREALFRYFLHRLRQWDARTAHGPDLMVANSNFIRSRIRRVYGRDAIVVHPPVSLSELGLLRDKDDYYVTAAFPAPYKRTDLVIEAFKRMPRRRLLVVGSERITSLPHTALSNITFAGHLPRKEYIKAVAEAKAFVFAGCEDFGIALAEAQAWGTPLIALGRGGACDIVRPLDGSPPATGVLFHRQTAEDICAAVEYFEERLRDISPAACRLNAARFSVERFRREIAAAFAQAIELNRRQSSDSIQLSLRA